MADIYGSNKWGLGPITTYNSWQMILQVDIDLVILGCPPFFSQVLKSGASKIRNHTHLEKTQDTLWTGWGTDSSEMMGHICIYVYILNISAYLRDQIKSCFFQVVSLHQIYVKNQGVGCYFSAREDFFTRKFRNSSMYQANFFGAPCHSIGFWTHQTYRNSLIKDQRIDIGSIQDYQGAEICMVAFPASCFMFWFPKAMKSSWAIFFIPNPQALNVFRPFWGRQIPVTKLTTQTWANLGVSKIGPTRSL